LRTATDRIMSQEAFAAELESARLAARRAGAAIMEFYGATEWQAKADASPVTRADHASNEIVTSVLRAAFPGDAILAEESVDSAARLTARRVWIVDPLDGTKEFLAQNGEFSVLIGLAVEGEPVLGVVYLPTTGVLYSATRGTGSWVEREGERTRLAPPAAEAGAALRLVGSRSHPDPFLLRMQEALGITDVAPSGSVGVKCVRIIDGDRDLYVHPAAHLKEWDTCAPEVVATEAGARVTDMHGRPLRYNKPDPVQPDGIMVVSPRLDGALHGRISALYSESLQTDRRQP
jgi:3'(2'), 5'-bisphosphate nucleotidase